MHRTQIYLPDDLYERLKARSRMAGLSQSALIRRTLEKDLKLADSTINVRQFLEQLQPLTSFADCEPEQYVTNMRNASRILRNSSE